MHVPPYKFQIVIYQRVVTHDQREQTSKNNMHTDPNWLEAHGIARAGVNMAIKNVLKWLEANGLDNYI